MIKKLIADDLKRTCNITNEDLAKHTGGDFLIGQERAEKALKFGLKLKSAGYNIYASGPPQSGKMSFVRKFAEEIALTEPVPPDICYIYNFENPKCPSLIRLPAGIGKAFAGDMDELVSVIKTELSKMLSSKELENEKSSIVAIYQEKRDYIVKNIQEYAKTQGFGVKITSSGIYFMPIVDGELISEEQYDSLSEEEKETISKSSGVVQDQAVEVMRQIKEFEKETRKAIDELEYSRALFCVGHYINGIMEKYTDYDRILKHLLAIKEDILSNISDYEDIDEAADEAMQSFVPWMARKSQDDTFTKYKVNLIVDNSGLKGAPVIANFKPTYASVNGEVEYDSENGNFVADFMKIKPGLLHTANGGYLILQAYDVLTSTHLWESIRQVIKTGEIAIEPLREYVTGIAVSSIKPEPAKVNVKVILVGASFYYDLLYQYDDEFAKFFKINAVFDYEMPYNPGTELDVASFIARYAKEKNLGGFDITAICRLIEYSSRMAERQYKLSSQLGKLTEIMEEASAWLEIEHNENGKSGAVQKQGFEKRITKEHIEKAIKERDFRNNIYEEKLSEMIDRNIVMLDTAGWKTAQINGLAVIDTGEYVFAKPSRITATTYVGKSGIVNIEKEAEMSGSIHDKGVEVLTGYLGQKYAQEFPLSLSCRICFEQNYSGIDGDSASSTELYTILSSLAGVPINQELAVTGSINQRGEIQPIGGVTYKIEGFFDLCEKRGLTGGQGVIIPEQNILDLTLNNNIVEAVNRGLFHIYAINHIDDGIELLTGIRAGKLNEKGKYPPDSVHGKVYKRLKDFYKKSILED